MHRRLGAISPLQVVREPATASKPAIATHVLPAHTACTVGELALVATFAAPLAERLRWPARVARRHRCPPSFFSHLRKDTADNLRKGILSIKRKSRGQTPDESAR